MLTAPMLVQLIGGVAVLGAGVGLIIKGQQEVGIALAIAGAAELGAKTFVGAAK